MQVPRRTLLIKVVIFMTSNSIIAAFDFDNTLTDRDSLLPFLVQLKGWPYTTTRLAMLTPAFLCYGVGSITRQGIKEKILKQFICSQPENELKVAAEKYASSTLNQFIKPHVYNRLKWHQTQGHRCILVSASLELYLKPWAVKHGLETALASRLELNEAGHATGNLVGLNCWGAEKVRRLIEYAGSKQNYQLYAYGDSRGDQELLNLADHPFYRY